MDRRLLLSTLVAGTWRLHERAWTAAETLRWIEQWADLGVTSFDHADLYGGYTVEALFGDALALRPGLHDGTLDGPQQRGRRPMIWSPLAGGRWPAGAGQPVP